jgi:hypothetical protein
MVDAIAYLIATDIYDGWGIYHRSVKLQPGDKCGQIYVKYVDLIVVLQWSNNIVKYVDLIVVLPS